VDINPAKFDIARKFGATDCINPKDYPGKTLTQVMVEASDAKWGWDFTFECVGDVGLMRAALESAHRGWGESIVIGVAGAGKEISTRPFQLVTGRIWKGTALGGYKTRSEIPPLVEKYMSRQLLLDEYITHVMPLDEINTAFDLMHKGESIRSVIVL